MTYISWLSDSALYLEDYLMYKAVTLAGGTGEPLLTCSSLSIFYPVFFVFVFRLLRICVTVFFATYLLLHIHMYTVVHY